MWYFPLAKEKHCFISFAHSKSTWFISLSYNTYAREVHFVGQKFRGESVCNNFCSGARVKVKAWPQWIWEMMKRGTTNNNERKTIGMTITSFIGKLESIHAPLVLIYNLYGSAKPFLSNSLDISSIWLLIDFICIMHWNFFHTSILHQ